MLFRGSFSFYSDKRVTGKIFQEKVQLNLDIQTLEYDNVGEGYYHTKSSNSMGHR